MDFHLICHLEIIVNLNCCHFGLKMPIWAPKLGDLGEFEMGSNVKKTLQKQICGQSNGTLAISVLVLKKLH